MWGGTRNPPNYVRRAIFGQFLPLPRSHFVTHPGTLPKVRHTSRTPRFLEGLVQKTWTKAPLFKFCLNCSRGFCQRVFCLEGFVRGGFCPFPFCQNTSVTPARKLNITLNFMFCMYNNKIYKCDVTYALYPSPCHKLSHLLGPPRA